MGKTLDLRKTVYALCREDPEVTQIMLQAGFSQIGDPVVCATAGRVMTIPMGARLKRIPLENIIALFEARGYEVVGFQEET